MPRQEAKFKINMDKYYIFKQYIYKKRHKRPRFPLTKKFAI